MIVMSSLGSPLQAKTIQVKETQGPSLVADGGEDELERRLRNL